ncbi:hypothetical protein L5515_014368 [Caenorhabditis briggsae]|uniref:RRM domain-containing protein n=1 Tax=Caenorhabditis briggsae TaxID=6238 RepID=A0AAE9J8I8_CAEBR|nr:hypothetical protein L5515_014368 [Caenorhabditis briggsae]
MADEVDSGKGKPAFCNVEMVHAPLKNAIRESRHVAVHGLPRTIPDEDLHKFFSRFGPIQQLFRSPEDLEGVLYITYMDTRSASVACNSEKQFNKDTPFRIEYCNPETLPNMHMASHPSTANTLPHRSSTQHAGDRRSPKRSQSETSNGPVYPQSKEGSNIPSNPEIVATVHFTVCPGNAMEKEVWDRVKIHSKRSGIPHTIVFDQNSNVPGQRKLIVHYRQFDRNKLQSDKSLLMGSPADFHIAWDKNESKVEKKMHVTVQILHKEGTTKDLHLEERFSQYGQVLDVFLVKAPQRGYVFAVIVFPRVADAHRAMNDKQEPKPLAYAAPPSRRLLVMNTQPNTMDQTLVVVRSYSDDIKDILVDYAERRAVVIFEDIKKCTELMRKLKVPTKHRYSHYIEQSTAVDYCPDKLYDFIVEATERRKQEAAEKKRQAEEQAEAEKTDVLSRNTDTAHATPSGSLSQGHKSARESKSPVEEQHKDQEEAECYGTPSTSNECIAKENSDDDNGFSGFGLRHSHGKSEDGETDTIDDSPGPSKRSDSERKQREEPEKSNGGPEDPGTKRVKRFSQHGGIVHSGSNGARENSIQPFQSLPSTSKNQDERELFSNVFADNSYDEASAEKEVNSKRNSPPSSFDCQNDTLMRVINRMKWRPHPNLSSFPTRVDELMKLNLRTRVNYEKLTGRPFPKFSMEDDLRTQTSLFKEKRDYYRETPCKELDIRLLDWRKLTDHIDRDIDEFRAPDSKELSKDIPQQTIKSGGRPSLDESTRYGRLSFDSTNQPVELAQRSHSLSIGPTTPAFPTSQPLLVNTHHSSQPSGSGVTTPRSGQPPIPMSPVSRHNSVSSTGRPANIQALRHHSVMFPPDVSIPPPPIPPTNDEMRTIQGNLSRRSSETLPPLKSPPFGSLTAPIAPSPSQMMAATGTHSVSSSAHSTPRHSISGTPIHYEPPSTPKGPSISTPKTNKPEKVQVRHDSISKPGPSNAANALQARSQSMTSDHRKNVTPTVRDAGSDLYEKIMSNQPSMGFKKLPRIEKKPSALQNVHNQQINIPTASTSSAPSTSSNHAMLQKDKEREKEKRRKEKERELERERDTRKEVRKKETKEERHKRKELERAKREEDERRERKREKQRIREKEERRKEKEKERRKVEKEKLKKKKHRRDDSSDESGSSSDDDLDLDVRKSAKEMTQEEKDHQLAMILSRGSIIENLKSRRRSDKGGHDSFEKLRQKNEQAGTPRRVLIESSDDDDKGKDDDKDKSDSSSGEASETEQRFIPPPPLPPSSTGAEAAKRSSKHKYSHKEKGEVLSSDGEGKRGEARRKKRSKDDRDNRKRQKSLTNYSSDEHDREHNAKRVRREENDEANRHTSRTSKDEQTSRKRKLENRLSSDEESKRKIKQGDFRDIPHENISDEEESESAARVRRQSSSSNASSSAYGKKLKTPLVITTPSATPLQSPKILSPKQVYSKTSTSSKLPSITAQEPLVSPRSRNRTSSSTSTATNSSKYEAPAVSEKQLSPPVTAKSSVSSIDDSALHDEFNINSAIDSPASVTGKPMVLTKAAMKAFNSSSPRKLSNSSGQHDSSSDTSSSSSSSSDDDSDEDTVVAAEPNDAPPAAIENIAAEEPIEVTVGESSATLETHLATSTSPVLPVLPAELIVSDESKESSDVEPVVKEFLQSAAPIQQEEMNEESPQCAVSTEPDVERVEEEDQHAQSEDIEESLMTIQEDMQMEKESESVVQSSFSPRQEPEHVPAPVTEKFTSPKQVDTNPISPSAHTVISDQETDQAVQSIFDEEEADEFPQYPDFVMTNDDKEVPDKETVHPETVEKTSSQSTISSEGYSIDQLISPKPSTSQPEKNNDVGSIDTIEGEFPHIVNPIEQIVEIASIEPIENNAADEKYMDDSDEDYGARPLEIDESSPEHHTLEKSVEIMESENIPTNEKVQEDHHKNHELVQAPVQPQKPLEVITETQQSHQQVIQPSPQPAITPLSQPTVAQSASEIPQTSPTEGESVRARFDMVCHAAHGAGIGFSKETQERQAAVMAQQQEQMAIKNAQARQELLENQRRAVEEESLKRQQREQLDRKMEMDRQEKKRRIEMDRANMLAIQLAAMQKNPGQKNNMGFAMQNIINLMPPEARLLYTGFAGVTHGQQPGLANGTTPQLTPRPSSTASSSASVRTPQPPSTSLNRSSVEPSTGFDGAIFQRWFYNYHFVVCLHPFECCSSLDVVVVLPRVPGGARWASSNNKEARRRVVRTRPLRVNQCLVPAIPSLLWRERTDTMSSDESATSVAPNPAPTTSLAELSALLHQIATPPQIPIAPATTAPNPFSNLESLLSMATMANLTGAAVNPLSMFAVTHAINQANPVYQGIARALLSMNMGLLANQQASEVIGQQETLMNILAAKNGLPFQLPQLSQQPQQQPAATSQGGFAIPQGLPISLKRGNKDQLANATDRKKSCPPTVTSQGQQTLQQLMGTNAAPPPPPPPRSPSPPRKSMFENLPPEMKEKNEMFRKEILRRLDIILLEELGADDEEAEVKPDLQEQKQIPTSEEDVDETKGDSMGSEGSAFRRILSRSSTMNNSSSASASRTTTPSTTSSISSGPDSPPLESAPPLESDSLSPKFLDMLTSVAVKHREDSSSDALSANIMDEVAFTQHFPMVWTGRLTMKSTETMINLHLINGSETFLNGVLGRQLNEENPRRDSVKINQRLRLDNGQVDQVHGILTNPEYACCLALSAVTDYDELAKNESNLKASFIDYLIKKKIAGVSCLEEVDQKFKSARVHVFAPGEIVSRYLSELASSLYDYLQVSDTRYLLIVFTNDKSDLNMDGPPPLTSLAVPPISSN